MRQGIIAFALAIAPIVTLSPTCFAAPPSIRLAHDHRAELAIVVASRASVAVRDQAAVLAQYLERISGAKFDVAQGDGQTGLALGTCHDFPNLHLQTLFPDDGVAASERYLLRSHARGIYIIGASDLAVQHAAWDLLYRLGHRQFFPGEAWEIVPHVENPALAVDTLEKPDYAFRSIWYGYGCWDYNVEPLRHWHACNRAVGAFELKTGHAYEGILHHYQAEFKAHPEYLGLVKGQRTSSKFCISNPGLRKLVVRYAIDEFTQHPEQMCVSVEPSDGVGWCECDACQAMGSPSDRALTLANEVSAVLEEKYPGKYVAMYAYAQHSPPPKIPARPRVIVSCATSFLRGGMSIDEVIAGWKQQGVAQFGIREYYSVNTWDRDLPGAARGGHLDYLSQTIPRFHAQGARFLSAEASDNWGPNGLGYYLATRIMWDIREASRIEPLVADFLEKAFGPARQPMAAFYRLFRGPKAPLMSHDLIGRMYGLLGDASAAGGDAGVRARLDQLILYTRYVELYRAYEIASGPRRQEAFEQLIRHAYRMRRTMLVHTKGLYRDLDARDKAISIPKEAQWNVPEPKNPWKSSAAWSREELDRLVSEGLTAHRRVEFQEIAVSRQLAPAARRKQDLPVLADSESGRGEQVFYTWFQTPGTLELKITGGLIAHYRDRGNVRVDLLAVSGDTEQPLAHDASVPPDGKQRVVKLQSDRPGLHKVVVFDGHDLTEVIWPAGFARTIEVGRESNWSANGRRSGYFYVPPGTRVVGGYGPRDASAVIKDSKGREVFRFATLDGPDYFQIPVPAGEDGQLWSLQRMPGRVQLLTVPPYIARHPSELLLPQ